MLWLKSKGTDAAAEGNLESLLGVEVDADSDLLLICTDKRVFRLVGHL